MDYQTVIIIYRKGKAISIFLKEGEDLRYENIVDVLINPLEDVEIKVGSV